MGAPHVAAERCVALGGPAPTLDTYPTRTLAFGELPVRRALPIRQRRLVGPWCFLDRFGPYSFAEGKPMDVAPHPHIGLQTVTWLLSGEVRHDDSLGCEAVARPGGVNVMTAGRGIAHAEQTPARHSGNLDGVQLWVALPEAARHQAPAFQAVAEVPAVEAPEGIIHVFAGQQAGTHSPAQHHSPLLGVDLAIRPGRALEVELEPAWEHALLLLHGDAALEDQPIAPDLLHYLGTGRRSACFRSAAGARVLLFGGPPFPEAILMWWNFVARTPEEIAEARADWQAQQRFGAVTAYRGPRLSAPPLAKLARANPVS